jgi:spore coat protein A
VDAGVAQTPPLKRFVDPLPRPVTAIPDPSVYPGADYYEVTMRQGSWRFHRDFKPAPVWGYWATNPRDPHKPIGMGYLGPTIEVRRDHPTVVKWGNELPTTHLFQSVMDLVHKGEWLGHADEPPPYQRMSGNPIPSNVNVWNVVHQHGGFTPPQSDGLPDQSFSPDGVHARGYTTLDPGRVKRNEAIYAYTNHEYASTLWYHDHGDGITSLNCYAGLAGLWLLRDSVEERLGLPRGEFEVPLILQDRTFHRDGSLDYTLVEQEGATTPVVNGKAFPFLAVEPRRYRLRFLNASNERFWRLRFSVPTGVVLPYPTLPFWLIGTDAGLRAPLQMQSFLFGPAERYDVIVDFSQVPMGTKVTLQNFFAPVHYPAGDGPEISEVMQFKVTKRLSKGGDKTTPPKKLKPPAVPRIKPKRQTRRRQWVVYQQEIFETLTFNAIPFALPSQDFVKAGSTEIWEFINPHIDAHPMHVHLVWFEVLNRQPFDATAYQTDYEKWLKAGRKPADKLVLARYLTGPPVPPDPDEAGSRKDVVKAYPAMVTRIIINQFDPPTETIANIPGSGTKFPATYMQHCHIFEHEDDDLMRPWTIVRDRGVG